MEFTKGEHNIFNEKVDLIFLDDIQERHYQRKAQGETRVVTVADVVQNIIEVIMKPMKLYKLEIAI